MFKKDFPCEERPEKCELGDGISALAGDHRLSGGAFSSRPPMSIIGEFPTLA